MSFIKGKIHTFVPLLEFLGAELSEGGGGVLLCGHLGELLGDGRQLRVRLVDLLHQQLVPARKILIRLIGGTKI